MTDTPTLAEQAGFIVKPYDVTVRGHSPQRYIAATPAKARADAWRDYAGAYDVSFKDFMRLATVRRSSYVGERFGEPITVGGRSAFYVGHNRQYIQFVYDGGSVVLNSHPYDVEPPEARRGTPYYEAPVAAHLAREAS